ncbi:hypothetical protein KI387_012155, partial [Taxus chinensis]
MVGKLQRSTQEVSYSVRRELGSSSGDEVDLDEFEMGRQVIGLGIKSLDRASSSLSSEMQRNQPANRWGEAHCNSGRGRRDHRGNHRAKVEASLEMPKKMEGLDGCQMVIQPNLLGWSSNPTWLDGSLSRSDDSQLAHRMVG